MKNPIFTKKQLFILFSFIFLIIGVWAVLAFLAKEEYITRLSLWASLVFGTGSIITSIVAVGISIITLRREVNLRQQKLEEEANKFINENNDEILYLPLCLIANAYENHHKFSRKIYNSFNTLNKDLQNEVIKQLNYDYELIKSNQWIDDGIEAVVDFIKTNDLGRDYLHDNAKYFHRAMDYSTEQYDAYCEYAHIIPDVFNWNPKIFFKEDKAYQENVSFFDYVDSYLNAKENNSELFRVNKERKPINVLANIIDFSNCNEGLLCYWMMEVVASIAAIIIHKERKKANLDEIPHLSKGDAQIYTFEDRYLDVLIILYNLHLLRQTIKNKKE